MRKRKLAKAELRAAGVSPGLLVRRVGPDGRARLEQLTAETRPRPPFGPGLTNRADITIDRESEAKGDG
jgi:hypothetical protein